jgi:hypothetical protein
MTTTKATTNKWTRDQLRLELSRRKQRPATSGILGYTIPQAVTVAELEAELSTMPADHENREWREWELALATEHYRCRPNEQFIRHILTAEAEAEIDRIKSERKSKAAGGQR